MSAPEVSAPPVLDWTVTIRFQTLGVPDDVLGDALLDALRAANQLPLTHDFGTATQIKLPTGSGVIGGVLSIHAAPVAGGGA